jgi:pimeloyl-ACP methyl ester carboxylesterase
LSDGLTSIKGHNRWFDVLYMDRGADVTFVSFHAAVPAKATHYPVFSNHRLSEGLDVNYLGFADPVCGSAESLKTGWHLGSKRVDAQRFIPAIVKHALTSRSGQHLIFFGSSAGGFAALNYSAQFPGSVVLVVNPRVELLAEPHTFPDYAKAAYGATPERVADRVPTSMADLYSRSPRNTVAYLQNVEDTTYFDYHFRPFEQATRNKNDVFIKTGHWGDGHVVPPRDEFVLPLQSLVANAPNWSLALASLSFGGPEPG